MASHNTFQRIAEISSTGEITDLRQPDPTLGGSIDSEAKLARYLHLPYQHFDGLECQKSLVKEAKSDLEAKLSRAKVERPQAPVKEVLFDYWGTLEARNSYLPGEAMRELCNIWLQAVKQLKLYPKMELPVREL